MDVASNLESVEQLTSEQIEELTNAVLSDEHSIEEVLDITPKIKSNSPTLLMPENTIRFSTAIWYEEIRKANVTLVGVGGIGSYVAFLLSRLGIHMLNIWDPDRVEETNLSGQLYRMQDIGNSKVTSISSIIKDFSNFYAISSLIETFTSSCPTYDIMMCGFDNMEARKNAFLAWEQQVNRANSKDCLYIDGRLAAEEFQIFCITGEDDYLKKVYKDKWLFKDSEAEHTVCSYKQTSFCANMIASLMVNLFVNFMANKCNPLIPRDLPFMTSYDASTMILKTTV